MGVVLGVIGVAILVIILSKAGVGEGLITLFISMLLPAVIGTTAGAVASFVATPFIGIPVGICVFFAVLKMFSR